MVGLLSSVVVGCAFGNHGAEAMPMIYVSKAALPMHALTPARCLWWLHLVPLQHRLTRDAYHGKGKEVELRLPRDQGERRL